MHPEMVHVAAFTVMGLAVAIEIAAGETQCPPARTRVRGDRRTVRVAGLATAVETAAGNSQNPPARTAREVGAA
jgi:hypothetical protein